MSKAIDLLLYDDACSMCTFQTRLLTWLDWRHVVRLVPMSSSEASRVAPLLSREAMHEAIHCITPGGRIYRGARALRHVGMRIPLLLPLAAALWLPGVIGVAERVYRWAARNRYGLSRAFRCADACAMLPPRRPANAESAGKE